MPGAMAAHFKGLVNHYSPHNEPGLTCLFCGLVGRWPPYQKTIESWAKIGVRVAKGMVLETEAIRQALPDAVIVSVDPFFYGLVDRHLPPASERRCGTSATTAGGGFLPRLAGLRQSHRRSSVRPLFAEPWRQRG